MPTILSCTDGSIYARSVYDHSAWAAGRLGAEVHVLHMVEHAEKPAREDVSGTIGIDTSTELLNELVALAEAQGRVAIAKAQAVLADAQSHLTTAGVSKVVLVKRHGALVDSIGEFDTTADLVVIGKRGEHADFAKLHLGSNLERVIRTCRHPVLIASRAFQPIERFVLAYDGSPSVLKAVEFVLGNPLLKGLHCHLVRAGKVDDTARYYVEETAAKLRAAGYTVTSQATPGPADEVIGAAVKEQNANLLVMGAYGHSRIREFIVGSTTTALIRTVSTPVLVFR
ncbi:MAG: universal stress protein [Akkermansiaceae bacterium]|jgi:nucleotide-binding universal stress UspA family protein|nr:universal stress protein [Akkermansiaceae bacterium]